VPPSSRERLRFGELTIDVVATAETTAGVMSALLEVPPLVDTPRHVHANEDELFIAIAGDHVIELGEDEIRIGPGQSVFAPRGVPHAQRRVVEGQGSLMFICLPGGIEGFFRELALAELEDRLGPEAYAAASERYGITWL
jgi:mannose-6-phosphate isomerase-like protein (cupin superfamily)